MKERLGTAGKIAVASTMGVLIVSGETTGDPLAIPEFAIDYLQETPRIVVDFIQSDDCNRTTLRSDLYVRKLMQEEATEPETFIDSHEQAMLSAKKHNLHLADETIYIQRVDESESFEEIIEALNEYGKFHSISFSVPEEVSLRHYPIQYDPVNQKEISLGEIKSLSKDVLNALYFIPTEVTNFSNVNDVKLVDRIKIPTFMKPLKEIGNSFTHSLDEIRNQDNNPKGIFNPITRNIFIGINDEERDSFVFILKHELAHGVLFNYCGLFDSFTDDEFPIFNPEGFRYSNIDSLNDFPKVSPNDYGYESVYEDAAFITGGYIFSKNKVPINALSNTERDKILLMLARIDQVIPGYAGYWKDTKLE